MSEQDERQERLKEQAISGAAIEGIQRHGSAIKEHIVAYMGEDRETGAKLARSLKSISKLKINKQYRFNNEHQQAGFSAEVKEVANTNAERIIHRKATRVARTDDVLDSLGRKRVNDPLADIVELNADGSGRPGTEVQVKFVGASESDLRGIGAPKRILNKLQSKEYSKYFDNDVDVMIPAENYEKVMMEADQKIDELTKQLDKLKQLGKGEAALQKQQQIDKLHKIKKNLRKSSLSSGEALNTRRHPRWSTAKSAAKIANHAGVEQAKYGALIAGALSIIHNVVSCMKGEKDAGEAMKQLATDTIAGGAIGYFAGSFGALIKGLLQNASRDGLRVLSGTGLPAALASSAVSVGKIMISFLQGEIDGSQCAESLGKLGVGELGTTMTTTISSFGIVSTGPVIAQMAVGMAASTLGYMAAVKVYEEMETALREYDLAKEERQVVQAHCEESIRMIIQYRTEMNEAVEQYFSDHQEVFLAGFQSMDEAVADGDVNGFISGNAAIQKALGRPPQFTNTDEFDALMNSEESFKL